MNVRAIPARARARGSPRSEYMHQLVRWALYAMFVASAVHAGLQAWQAERAEAIRSADAELVDVAGAQRWLSQRIARFANLVATAVEAQRPQYAQDLRLALDRAAAQATRLEQLIDRQDARAPTRTVALSQALAAWRQAHDRLADQAGLMLRRLEAGGAPAWPQGRTQVDALADAALNAAQALVEELQRGARERQARAVAENKTWSALMVGLLLVLTALAAEPTARTVRRQYARLADQARELERLALVAQLTTNAVMITDAARRIVWTNDAFTRITGYERQEVEGRRPTELLRHDRAPADALARLREAADSQVGVRVQCLQRRKNGQDLWMDLDVQPLRNQDGEVSGHVHVASDITDRRLAQAEQRVAAIAFESSEAIAITDAKQAILKVNQAFTRVTGYTADEAGGKVIGRLLRSGQHDQAFYAGMWEALLREKHWHGEVWNRRKSGEVYAEWLSITAVTDEAGVVEHYVAVFSDITQKKQIDNLIHSLAFYDPLTDLPNRRLLRDRLQQVIATSVRQRSQAAVLFIDLDNFKELNDTMGHAIGDLLLVEVGKRLTLQVRSTDTVARQGGDEFVIILGNLSEEREDAALQAEAVAEKIRAELNKPVQLQGMEYRTSPSIGISLLSGHETTVDDLLKRADTAMYQAKRSGRNAIRFFDPAIHAAMEARLALQADLHRAVPEGQLRLHYQVQVGADGRIIGAEVLVRWLHPTRGLVPPSQFIPAAEDSDLIVSIGQWVLETACEQLRRWSGQAGRAHLQLAVNVSARQFKQADFVARVQRLLQQAGVDPSRLKLELTESLMLANVGDTVEKVRALRELGVRFAIDDFGTGQSSLAYLTTLPLDQLKIDQSFVRSIGITHTDSVIVQTIIGMANTLQLEVIAEGVETVQQRDFLAGHGCLAYQGYLFGRPCPIDELERALPQPMPA